MAARTETMTRAPSFVAVFNTIVQKLLRIGLPLGPNSLITIRGRQSGQPRTTPIAVVEIGGRRWVQSPFGDVNWVRNLRLAREATIKVGKREERVTSVELSQEESVVFFSDVLGPYVRSLPLGRWLLGSVLGARDILEDPKRAAERYPVFELRRIVEKPGRAG